VGIDPGTTTGICLLDLDGRLLNLKSAKNFSFSSILSFLGEQGDPLVFAADVTPAPDVVKKLAATFGAQVYQPRQDVSTVDKQAMASGFLKGCPD